MAELSNKLKRLDIEYALSFRNHKGANEKPDLLRSLVEKDVTRGYGVVIPLNKILRVPGLMLALMNIMKQNTIDEHGRICGNDRLIHL